MKKFLAVFDPLHFMESTMACAVYLARHTGAHLVGIFLEDAQRRSYSATELAAQGSAPPDRSVHDLNHRDDETRNAAVAAFEAACGASDVAFSVHRHHDKPLQELLHESIYADLLLVSPTETLQRHHEEPPTHFIRYLLEEVQCPVLLVP
ncbi:MAG: universal stress protein, partial [Chitinophagaceae bacterium]